MKVSQALSEIESIIKQTDRRELYLAYRRQHPSILNLIERQIQDRTVTMDAVFSAEDIQRAKKKSSSRADAERRAAAWAKENLRPDMMIKVVGTRDGEGIRLVRKVHLDREVVECQQVGDLHFFEGFPKIEWKPYITTHAFGKVRGTVSPVDTKRPMGTLLGYNDQPKPRTRGEWKISQSALK